MCSRKSRFQIWKVSMQWSRNLCAGVSTTSNTIKLGGTMWNRRPEVEYAELIRCCSCRLGKILNNTSEWLSCCQIGSRRWCPDFRLKTHQEKPPTYRCDSAKKKKWMRSKTHDSSQVHSELLCVALRSSNRPSQFAAILTHGCQYARTKVNLEVP